MHFEPKYVAILVATEKLKSRLYHTEDRLDMADQEVGRFVNLWDTLKQHSGATVIQGNFVTPSERAFGHYEMKVAHSIGSVVADINHRIALAARDARNVLLCDVDHLASEVGRRNWNDETLWTLLQGIVPAGLPATSGAGDRRYRDGRRGQLRQMRRARSGQHALGRRDRR